MLLERTGNQIKVSYVSPRPNMVNEGVTPGTPSFVGTVADDGSISGTAYRFSRKCGGPMPYAVSGGFDEVGNSIVLHGFVQYRDAACRPVYKAEKEALTFERATAEERRTQTGEAGVLQAP
jgi:hypothetical protein